MGSCHICCWEYYIFPYLGFCFLFKERLRWFGQFMCTVYQIELNHDTCRGRKMFIDSVSKYCWLAVFQPKYFFSSSKRTYIGICPSQFPSVLIFVYSRTFGSCLQIIVFLLFHGSAATRKHEVCHPTASGKPLNGHEVQTELCPCKIGHFWRNFLSYCQQMRVLRTSLKFSLVSILAFCFLYVYCQKF